MECVCVFECWILLYALRWAWSHHTLPEGKFLTWSSLEYAIVPSTILKCTVVQLPCLAFLSTKAPSIHKHNDGTYCWVYTVQWMDISVFIRIFMQCSWGSILDLFLQDLPVIDRLTDAEEAVLPIHHTLTPKHTVGPLQASWRSYYCPFWSRAWLSFRSPVSFQFIQLELPLLCGISASWEMGHYLCT